MALLASPTLKQLIVSVRSLLNNPEPLNSFWSDEELTNYLNEGVRLYFSEVLQSNEGYFTTITDLDITANTETVALPTDCFEVKALYKKVTDGYAILPYKNNLTDDYSNIGGTSANSYIPSYYFRANNLVLRPIPNFSETGGLRIEYVQFPDTMVNGGDTLTTQISPIFKQVIEIYAVYKAKLKESLVSGNNVHANAEEHLGTLVKVFRDTLDSRSKNPSFIIPFNPEF